MKARPLPSEQGIAGVTLEIISFLYRSKNYWRKWREKVQNFKGKSTDNSVFWIQ